MKRETKEHTYLIRITGLVQGVGFRPFIYRIATQLNINGNVDNRNDGVFVKVNGDKHLIETFINEIRKKAPEAAVIENISVNEISYIPFYDFKIVKSDNNKIIDEITEISPDIAVCEECLKDMKTQPHRINYPFTNCTNCGPRFTIIKELPYDRKNTTMAPFKTCETCTEEYTDVMNRRFHAQPVACNNCGPHYTLFSGNKTIDDLTLLLETVSKLLENGETVALKGMGGFTLICDATDEKAVSKLRNAKHRDGKPMAVLFRNINTVKKYASLDKTEEKLLESWRRPIVLLKTKKSLAKSVSVGFSTVGALLPYMPFHYLLFEKTKCDALVFTSANIAGEPIIIDNNKALDVFTKRCSAVITYNREIYNRTDDSLAFVVNKTERLIRRSRGYAPSPVRLDFNVDGILATGAELVNTFCIGRTSQAILSQHIGDLKNAETLEFFEESISRYKKLFKFSPKVIACDLHPDYLSSRYAEAQHLPLLKIQHHHAHMASCMAENKLNEPVIGIIFDGTGLGTDGNIWGGEFLYGDYFSFNRFSHFNYIPLPGGDKVTKEPWRSAISYLYQTYGKDFMMYKIPFIEKLNIEKTEFIIQMIEKNINSPLSSSAGRLFDAVSALLNICTESGFHAEAPMRLEDVIPETGTDECYEISSGKTIDLKPVIKGIVNDIKNNTDTGIIAAKFHNTIVEISVETALSIRKITGINKIVLSGGTFQNRYLCNKTERKLKENKFDVFIHQKVPANDGGIALGQLAIAANQLNRNR